MAQAIDNGSLQFRHPEAGYQKKKHKRKKERLSSAIFIICMLAWPVLQFLVFWLYVNFGTIFMSFQKLDYGSGQIVWVGLENYEWLWDKLTYMDAPDLWYCIRNSIILFLVNNFVILPISLFAAYIFYKKLPGRNFYRVVFFLPNIISIVVLTMAFSFMLDSSFGPFNELLKAIGLGGIIPANGWLGDKNTAMGTIVFYCIWAGIGGNIILVTGAMNRIPKEVIEAGQIDGIGMWREFFRVVVPLIGPTIATLFINGITAIFTIFLQSQLLTKGGPYGHLSGTIALYIVELVDGGELYHAATVGVFFSIIGIALIVVVKKVVDLLTPDIEY